MFLQFDENCRIAALSIHVKYRKGPRGLEHGKVYNYALCVVGVFFSQMPFNML